LTSPYARPDQPALAELERLLDALEKELTTWRERCLKAEQDLTQGKGKGQSGPELLQARQRIAGLEGENRSLQQRIGSAREQIEQLRSRLRFVEEHDAEGVA
jgi:predicted  nucleic acid-binding Zn-ribbon protein